MSAPAPPGGSVRPSRVERASQARRTRRALLWAVVAAVLVAGLAVYVVTRDDGGGATSDDAEASDPAEPSSLLALQLNGGPAPMLALVGAPADGSAFTMPLSSELTVVMPGQGETSMAGVAALPGESMRVAMSNMAGVWVEHFAVLTLRDLAASVDAAGGLDVNLPSSYPTTGDALGPGEMTLSGSQVKGFLAGATDDAGVRWEILLNALLADPMPLVLSEDAETDDVGAVDAVLDEARGAEVLEMPTERVTSTIVVPIYPALDELLAEALDTPTPVSTIVQNGSGEPGVGEAVATRIIPAGFRVVLSQNAQAFDVAHTDVFANGPDHEAEARALRRALGVGRVRVAAVPSNVGDITIVVGKDFTA